MVLTDSRDHSRSGVLELVHPFCTSTGRTDCQRSIFEMQLFVFWLTIAEITPIFGAFFLNGVLAEMNEMLCTGCHYLPARGPMSAGPHHRCFWTLYVCNGLVLTRRSTFQHVR